MVVGDKLGDELGDLTAILGNGSGDLNLGGVSRKVDCFKSYVRTDWAF